MENSQALLDAYRSLLHISELISSEHKLPQLISLVLRYAIQLSGAERGVVVLKEGDELSVAETHNADKEKILGKISKQIAELVIEKGELVVTHDAMSDVRFAENMSVILHKLRSILCIPIVSLGKTIGVLYLDRTHSASSFTDFDVEIQKAYCQQVGIALENAKLIDLYERQKQQISEELHEAEIEKDQAATELKSEKKGWLGKFLPLYAKTQSPKMLQVFETLSPLVNTNLSILIHGDSGTGKELLAKGIHYNGLRKKMPFIVANCGAIPENLVESELFGYKAGAFTGATKDKKGLFEAAHRGTLFLDEVGELSLAAQVKLLRVLQEGEIVPVGDTVPRKIDVRVLSATHRNLKQLIGEAKFREDLYYRLSEFQIDLPPLRERREDIPLLVETFIEEYKKEHDLKKRIEASPEMLKCFMEYGWPGNVRELKNVIRVGCALKKNHVIRPENFPESYSFLSTTQNIVDGEPKKKAVPTQAEGMIYDPALSLDEHEKLIYAHAFKHFHFQPKETFESLRVSNSTFFKKIKKWDLRDEANPIFKKVFEYLPKKSLEDHIDQIISEAYIYHNRQSYKVIQVLKISPGYFYKWKKTQGHE